MEIGGHVLWSHGMGVKKDAKLYRVLRDAISPRGYAFHTFSYDIEHDNGDTTVRPFHERPAILEQEIERLETARKVGQKLIFMGWSQGCLPTGFVDLSPFDEVVYLNAMVRGGNEGIISNMEDTVKSDIEERKEVEVMRWPLVDADGNPYTTNVPMTYFSSMHFDRFGAYRRASEQKRLKVFRGTRDNMKGLIGEYELSNADYYDVEGAGHGFGGDASKAKLIDALGRHVFPLSIF